MKLPGRHFVQTLFPRIIYRLANCSTTFWFVGFLYTLIALTLCTLCCTPDSPTWRASANISSPNQNVSASVVEPDPYHFAGSESLGRFGSVSWNWKKGPEQIRVAKKKKIIRILLFFWLIYRPFHITVIQCICKLDIGRLYETGCMWIIS